MAEQNPRRELGLYGEARSTRDASVNWVREVDPGAIETRFVRREEGYFAVYLSTQTGCRQACRMCHLTATGQTRLRDVAFEELIEQAEVVLAEPRETPDPTVVHFNFMARGEPLASRVVIERAGELFDALWRRADAQGLRSRFLVSTILPRCLDRPLEEVFDRYAPELYYSLYTVDEAVRRRWLPRALPVPEALDRLAAWQRHSYKIIKIHFAFIEGVNDAIEDVHAVCDAIEGRHLYVHVNVVRYNPPSPEHGREPPEAVLRRNMEVLRTRLPNARVELIPRVGLDVNASCGMFMRPRAWTA